ncbi:MAG: thioredoxin family protein [Caldimonas sp.]
MSAESPPLFVACLCAAWCGACRDYRAVFETLALSFAGSEFAWIDVEDRADALGELDVEDFPTLFIARGGETLFLGPVTPHLATADRLVRSALAGELAATVDPVQADLPTRLRAAARHIDRTIPS